MARGGENRAACKSWLEATPTPCINQTAVLNQFSITQVWERHPAAMWFSPSGNAVSGQKMTV
jgi:hypothetical protein